MKLGAWLAGVVVVVCSTVASAEAPPRTLGELRAQISEILLREGVPGAGIALIDGDQILWAGGVGGADRATARPVTADTLFRVGSITKSFVALALVQLAEQGRIDLRAPVAALAAGCLVQALRWLPLPGSILGRLHRLVFGLAACCATAYLGAYGIIGIRLWSY